MSSTHPLKTPPLASGTANAVGHLEASFTSPVYKVVLLPGASSPHSTLLPYRHEQSRRKIARRVSRQPVRQLQFPLSDADSDIDDIICSFEEGSDGLLVRPSRNDFTVDELRSLPIYERLPIKLEDLLSDDETAVNITVESAAASSNVEDVAIARSNGSLLSRNRSGWRANTSLSGELRETPTILYRNKTTSLNAEQACVYLCVVVYDVCGGLRHYRTAVASLYEDRTNQETCKCTGGMEEKDSNQLKVRPTAVH